MIMTAAKTPIFVPKESSYPSPLGLQKKTRTRVQMKTIVKLNSPKLFLLIFEIMK
jgi:hypothetical protein